MSKRFFILIIIVMFLGGSACRDLLIDSQDPKDTPENNFEIFWQEFDRYYSFFELKKIDWNAQYDKYRPKVNAQTSETELFSILSEMVDIFKDGHVNIYTPLGNYFYNLWKDSPKNLNLDVVIKKYLANSWQYWDNLFVTGVPVDGIGYIYISTFGNDELWEKDIDKILEGFKDMKGLVIDVRDNGGGNSNLAEYLANRFADQKRLHAYVQWRNGPKHTDFSLPEPYYVEPAKKWRFSQPIALLTNRGCFSSTETFVLSMRILPQVTVVGDLTGGGSGNPLPRELPNGWVYRFSRWIELTPEKEAYEGIGLVPDVRVDITPEDELVGKDTILDTALDILKNQTNKL